MFLLVAIVATLSAQTTAEDFKNEADKKAVKGDCEDAIKLYKKAIELHTDKPTVYTNLAMCYYNSHQDKDAGKTLDLLMNDMPDNFHTYCALSSYHIALNQFYDAKDIMDLAIKKFTDAPDSVIVILKNSSGITKSCLRDFEGALNDFKYAHRIDTTDFDTWCNMAPVYDEIGKKDSAIYFYNKITAKQPDNILLCNNLGFLYTGLERYDDALKLYSNAIKQIAANPGKYYDYRTVGMLHNNYGFVLFKKGDYRGALKQFDESLKNFQVNSYVYRNRALLYIEQKKYDEACKDLNHAIALGFADQYGPEVDELLAKHCK